jgi:tetratricopeptide (TPR) repeat protein
MRRLSTLRLFLAGSVLLAAPAFPQQDRDRLAGQAQSALSAKDWPNAAAALEQLARLEPSIPEVHANLGLAYYSAGRYPDAERAFERALKLNPKMAQARVLLGICKAELGRNEDAVRMLEPAFRQPPEPDIGRLVGLALQRAYARSGRFPDAARIAEELLRRYPDDPEILYHSSALYADRSGDITAKLFEQAPDSVWIHFLRAQVQESLKRYDLARDEYRAVVQMSPNLPGARFRLAKAILLNSSDPGAVKEAQTVLHQELALSPWNADAEYELGEIARLHGDLNSALTHFSKAVTYQPAFLEARIAIARTLLKQNKPAEAATHLEQAVKISPRDKTTRFLLASAYKSLGDTTRAETELREYRKIQSDKAFGSKETPENQP